MGGRRYPARTHFDGKHTFLWHVSIKPSWRGAFVTFFYSITEKPPKCTAISQSRANGKKVIIVPASELETDGPPSQRYPGFQVYLYPRSISFGI